MRRIFRNLAGLSMGAVFLLLAISATAEKRLTDLLDNAAEDWHMSGHDQWYWTHGMIVGKSKILDGDITDPEASAFLVSQQVFGGDISVTLDVSFQNGRYIGVYLDFDRETQSGIWMATGHPLADDAPDNEVERGYIKTVENGFWIVRASGEIVIEGDEIVRLRFTRAADDYSIYQDDRLIATYRKPGGYPAGPLQIRITNAQARILRLQVESDWIK